MDIQEAMAEAIVKNSEDRYLELLWRSYKETGANLRASGRFSWTWNDLTQELVARNRKTEK
jgi:hypothetical protein